jgi:site-specific DNA recombinase
MENLDKRYFDNPNLGDEKYNKYVLQFAIELKAIEEQIDMNRKKLSNHKKTYRKSS